MTGVAADLGHVTRVPHSSIRRRIAERMVASTTTSAHVYATIDVDFDNIDRLRRELREDWRAAHGFGLTFLPFIAVALVKTIAEFPELNARFEDRELVIHHDVGLGIAVDLDFKGLVVPVMRSAQTKRLPEIACEINALATRAKSRALTADDLAGGTFTVTNPGPFGARTTLPLINQPQVAILASDCIAPRPVVINDGTVAVHPVGNLTLAWDHRAFDGAYASSALCRIRDILESHEWTPELAHGRMDC